MWFQHCWAKTYCNQCLFSAFEGTHIETQGFSTRLSEHTVKPIFCKTHFDKEYCYNEANQGVNVYNSIVNGNNKAIAIPELNPGNAPIKTPTIVDPKIRPNVV